MEKRLNEIQERKTALLKELEGDVTSERLSEIEAEQRALATEEELIRTKMDLAGKLGNVIEKPEERHNADEAEQRAAAIKESGRMEITAAETRSALVQRATTIATDTLAKPTKVGSDIADSMESVSSIVDQVNVQDLTGCASFEESYVKTEMTAGTRTDGEANKNASDPVFRVAKISPYLVNVTAYVSKNIKRLSPLAYEAKVKTLAIKALKKKVANLIANGETGSFDGIKIAQNTKKENIYKELIVESNAIGADTLRKIAFSYGGSEDLGGNARLYLTKEDLAAFGAVRGTSEKKAVYEITPDAGNPNCGVIKDGGTIVPYTIMSGLTSLSTSTKGTAKIQTMLYGDPKNFELGLFGPYTVEVSADYKFAEGLLTVMGEAMVGGNITVDGGFVVVTLGANTTGA